MSYKKREVRRERENGKLAKNWGNLTMSPQKCEIIFEQPQTEKKPIFSMKSTKYRPDSIYRYLNEHIDINFEILKNIDILSGKNRYRIELEITDIAHHYNVI